MFSMEVQMKKVAKSLYVLARVPWKAKGVRQSTIYMLALLLIGSAMLGNAVRYRHHENRLRRTLAEQSGELQRAKHQLLETNRLLATAESKLGYLRQHKTVVQVTAYTGKGRFANGTKTTYSYAVPARILPQDKVLNVALSPTARLKLRARMNDYILLLDKDRHRGRLARFVDTTSAHESRPVVDVFFARRADAIAFGRQRFFAVNISAEGSPFTADFESSDQ